MKLHRNFLKSFATVSLLLIISVPLLIPQAMAQNLPPLVISAIPDQDADKLQYLYSRVAEYLSEQLDISVQYRPVNDYLAAVTAFRVGDLQLVWFGGLSGIQARLQVPGAQAIVQRDVDSQFHSVFIANSESGIEPFETIDRLTELRGHTFTFGSESSTSGRLMPQYYLEEAGVELSDFEGDVGFSGSHDATIRLVEVGAFDAGSLNERVWEARLAEGDIDTEQVYVVWRTPAYFDYHWVIHPDVLSVYGADFNDRVTTAFLDLDPSIPEQREILELFTAERFVETNNSNYGELESIARQIGLIVDDTVRSETTEEPEQISTQSP